MLSRKHEAVTNGLRADSNKPHTAGAGFGIAMQAWQVTMREGLALDLLDKRGHCK